MNDASGEPCPRSVEELEDHLSRPPEHVVQTLATLDGDLILLGVGGKMGPTMARMARRAFDAAGLRRRVIGVSRFSTPGLREKLSSWGVETLSCDLLDAQAVRNLPDAPLVVSMSGFKFGASANPGLTWAMNCYLPMLVSERYARSRIVAFSSGNVYGMVELPAGLVDSAHNSHNAATSSGVPSSEWPTVTGVGSRESDALRPDGEYAMTAVGRERMYSYASQRWGFPLALLRLNYATELRYGVLVDLARQVASGEPVELAMGFVNVIWLRDANAMALQALRCAEQPAAILNLAGRELLSVRQVCQKMARSMNRKPVFFGEESTSALLNDGVAAYQQLGEPQTDIETMLRWTADWVQQGGENAGKPTRFQVRSGRF